MSVVVPVYNPGPYLHECAASIVGQSMPAEDFEAIFVDDGSTDDSPAFLDDLAARHPNVRVIHQPNSGWPGKPRNVGIDAARGEYVYFVDHDDLLGREALERLHAFATRNQSDIVIGKMAGHGRNAPRQLFLKSRDRVTLADSGIIGALSPHKVFRRAFLNDHGIRYPEGRRRLEDQVFVVRAYFAAAVISILADYTCYYHLALEARANAASGRYDPSGGFDPTYYYPFLREVLDVVEANTEPGPLRDRLLLRFTRHELLGRLVGPRFRMSEPGVQRILLTEIQSTVRRYIPATVDALLPPPQRTQMALVRADRLDLLVEFAKYEHRITIEPRVRALEAVGDGRLRLAAEAELRNRVGPIVFERRSDSLLLPLPPRIAAAVPDETRSMPLPVVGYMQIVLRRRTDSAEIVLTAPPTRRLIDHARGARVSLAIEVVIDPASPAEDFALRTGRWDALARFALAGYKRDVALRQPAGIGRTRQVALVDGELAMTSASWDGLRGRLPGALLSAAASPTARPLRRWLRGRGRRASRWGA